MVLVKFIHTMLCLKLKRTNPYEMNLTAHMTYCQSFCITQLQLSLYLMIFFFYLEKMEGELEGSGKTMVE